MVRVIAACVAGVMVVGVLTGCGAVSEAEAARNNAPATEEAEAEDTATTATGIEFINVPISLAGVPAEAYSAIAVYERAVWRASTEQDAGLTFYQSGAPILEVGAAAPATGQGTAVVDGGILVSIGDITVDGATATGIVCRDLSGVTLDGAAAPVDAPQQIETTLSLVDEAWQVDSLEHTGTC